MGIIWRDIGKELETFTYENSLLKKDLLTEVVTIHSLGQDSTRSCPVPATNPQDNSTDWVVSKLIKCHDKHPSVNIAPALQEILSWAIYHVCARGSDTTHITKLFFKAVQSGSWTYCGLVYPEKASLPPWHLLIRQYWSCTKHYSSLVCQWGSGTHFIKRRRSELIVTIPYNNRKLSLYVPDCLDSVWRKDRRPIYTIIL